MREVLRSVLFRRRKLLVASLVSVALVVAGVAFIAAQRNDPQTDDAGTSTGAGSGGIDTNAPMQGAQLPDLELTDARGGTLRLADLRGTPLVVNFWYSTCPPCQKELPEFAQVAASLDGIVRFVGIIPLDAADAAVQFAAERGMTYDNLLDPDGRALDALGVAVFPTTLLVRSDGTIASQHAGAMTAEQLRAAIDDHLLER